MFGEKYPAMAATDPLRPRRGILILTILNSKITGLGDNAYLTTDLESAQTF